MDKITPKWPAEWEQGLIKTSNAMGIMTLELSPPSQKFVELAKTAKKPLVDVGAAYGAATFPALEAGATVIACDLAADHLQVIRGSIPDKLQNRIITIQASFPDELHFSAGSLSGILMSQLIHFFDGPTVERALQKCYEWLEPNGKIFITVITANLGYYTAILPEYNRRLAAGEKWPGIFDPREFAPEKWKNQLPTQIHVFDIEVLRRVTEATGFVVEEIDYFCFKNLPDEYRTNGKEYVGMVARKQ